MNDGTGGTYTLLIELPTETGIEVGALGELHFEAGWYAYTGSALGSGGFARVDRHRELAAGDRSTRHWHVDYLLGHGDANLDRVVRSAGVDAECRVAAAVRGDPVPDFGCSDCDCRSHLTYSPDRQPLVESVLGAHPREDKRCGSG
ncbi:MAG: GIY-YIG nuclease family protein [Haloarculaceae archaeon]